MCELPPARSHNVMYLCNITRERERVPAILTIMTKHKDADGARPSHSDYSLCQTVTVYNKSFWFHKRGGGSAKTLHSITWPTGTAKNSGKKTKRSTDFIIWQNCLSGVEAQTAFTLQAYIQICNNHSEMTMATTMEPKFQALERTFVNQWVTPRLLFCPSKDIVNGLTLKKKIKKNWVLYLWMKTALDTWYFGSK